MQRILPRTVEIPNIGLVLFERSKKAKHLNARSARSSCGVEGIVIKTTPLKVKIEGSKSHLVYSKMKERLSKS